MNRILVVACISIYTLILSAGNFQNDIINPTGTYILQSETTKVGNEYYGYFGLIQVKNLSNKKIVMIFSINKGAPSYNSGMFVDTLHYQNNLATFTMPSVDASCSITFNFTAEGVTVKEKTKDFKSGCGFGHAVVADGYFKKVSSDTPVLRNPATDEVLK